MCCCDCCFGLCCCCEYFDYTRQFLAISHKNWLLKIRQPFSLIFEILLPCLIMLVLASIYAKDPKGPQQGELYNPPTVFDEHSAVLALYGDMCKNSRAIAFVPGNGMGFTVGQALLEKYPFYSNCAGWNTSTSNSPAFVYTYDDEDSLNSYISSGDYARNNAYLGFYAAVIFTETDAVGSHWSYTLRFNASGKPAGSINTFSDQATNPTQLDFRSQDYTTYADNGFMALQSFIDNYILSTVSSSVPTNASVSYQPFPTIPHYSSTFASQVATFLGLLYTLVFMWPVSRIVKQVVEEKELRIRESMKIMGLSDSVLWTTWLVLYLIIFFISAIIIIIITSSNMYQFSNKGYAFVVASLPCKLSLTALFFSHSFP
jgi:hypothetical protein